MLNIVLLHLLEKDLDNVFFIHGHRQEVLGGVTAPEREDITLSLMN